MTRLVLVVAVAIAPLGGQTFEVASVKPAPETVSNGNMRIDRCAGGPASNDPSRYTCRGQTLKTLLEIAYHVTSAEISGPGWIDSDRYDIIAKPPAGATAEQIEPMLRALLEERFALRIRREEKARPIYVLLAPRGAAKLKRSTIAPEDPQATIERGRAAGARRRALAPGYSMMHIDDRAMTMGDLALVLSSRLDRPVQDMTGLEGTFAIELDFTLNMNGSAGDDASRPLSVFEALQDQLGLRLEGRKGEAVALVVEDALRKPKEN